MHDLRRMMQAKRDPAGEGGARHVEASAPGSTPARDTCGVDGESTSRLVRRAPSAVRLRQEVRQAGETDTSVFSELVADRAIDDLRVQAMRELYAAENVEAAMALASQLASELIEGERFDEDTPEPHRDETTTILPAPLPAACAEHEAGELVYRGTAMSMRAALVIACVQAGASTVGELFDTCEMSEEEVLTEINGLVASGILVLGVD